MQVSHSPTTLSASFGEPNLVALADLASIIEIVHHAGLHELSDRPLSVPADRGANSGAKIPALVAGMAVLRHSGMKLLFGACYAPSMLGSFLRSFTFGHIRSSTQSPRVFWETSPTRHTCAETRASEFVKPRV